MSLTTIYKDSEVEITHYVDDKLSHNDYCIFVNSGTYDETLIASSNNLKDSIEEALAFLERTKNKLLSIIE